MKYRIILLTCLSVLFLSGTVSSAQAPVYLSDAFSPSASHGYKPAKEHMYSTITAGGVPYKKGFTLFTTYGPTKYGYAEFNLNGKYSTLMFILGTGWGDSYSGTEKGVFVVKADGRKLLDKVISNYDVPEQFEFDVKGVQTLRFEIVTGDVPVAIVEPTLWTASQKPMTTGRTELADGTKPLKLVQELRPYKQGNRHRCVSVAMNRGSNDLKEVKLSGRSYDSGIRMNTDMALIGNAPSWTYFNLGGKYETLTFLAGPMDSDSGTIGTAWLVVKGDSKILFEQEIVESSLGRQYSVNISGCKQVSIESEQASGSSSLAVVEIMAYPPGYDVPSAASGVADVGLAPPSPALKALPDVCKLILNIPPYAIAGGASREDALFDGRSEHITFSMGGTRFWEGVVLQSSTSLFHDNTHAHALFDLGGEFDWATFTVGWVGKCGVLKNDTLRVYADTEMVLELPLKATGPNLYCSVPLNKCRRLTFEKVGMSSLNHPAFGVADIVVYRGKPVENDLFVHPKPDLPEVCDLVKLGPPYIHYVYTMRDYRDEIYYDGTTQRRYFQMSDGSRINNGFMLQTSVHFDLEMGPTGNAGAGIISGALGSSIMIGAVSGATISAVSPFGALIMLASGGTAMESSCAAFNTWGAYDYVTFTVAPQRLATNDPISLKSTPLEKLQVGADGEVVAEIEIHDKMTPTQYTIPINRCHQLMFWLECADWTSAPYIIYDAVLSRGGVEIGVPDISNSSSAAVVAPPDPYDLPVAFDDADIGYTAPKRCGKDNIDDYFVDVRKAMALFDQFLAVVRSQDYSSKAKYVSSSSGKVFRAITLESPVGEKYSITSVLEANELIIKTIKQYQMTFTSLSLSKTTANMTLPELGFNAFTYSKYIKASQEALDEYKALFSRISAAKQKEIEIIKALQQAGLTVDGQASDDSVVYITE